MKFIYQEHSLKSGIYKILNTHTNRIYVGQAREFKERWKGHSKSLTNNKHSNKFLQADFNRSRETLGHDDFLEFHVLEVMEGSTKEQRNQREEFYIHAIWDQQNSCYNFQKSITSSIRHGFSKTPTKTSMLKSENAKKLWCSEDFRAKINTIEARQKIACALKKHLLNQDVLAKHKELLDSARPKAIAAQEKHFGIILAPDGRTYDVKNLARFCREHELVIQCMHNVFAHKQKQHRGWKLP